MTAVDERNGGQRSAVIDRRYTGDGFPNTPLLATGSFTSIDDVEASASYRISSFSI